MNTILIMKYLKATAKYGLSLSNLVAFLRLNLLVKISLHELLDNPFQTEPEPPPEIGYKQGVLFEWGD